MALTSRHITQLSNIAATAAIFMAMGLASCQRVESDRVPSMAVNISLADAGIWNTYGVAGFGSSRNFILSSSGRQPVGFPYHQGNATGFGGVMLIIGMDPYDMTADTPLAYDLACPVEMKADVRVAVDPQNFDAVCSVCGSHYDVTMGGGAPLSGPAAAGNARFGLRRYRCIPTDSGGYVITN